MNRTDFCHRWLVLTPKPGASQLRWNSIALGVAGSLVIAAMLVALPAMAQTGPLEGGAGTPAAGGFSGHALPGQPVLGSTPPEGPAFGGGTNAPAIPPPEAAGPGLGAPATNRSFATAPLLYPTTAANAVVPLATNSSNAVPTAGQYPAAKPPMTAPAPLTGPIGPLSPTAAESPPAVPPPTSTGGVSPPIPPDIGIPPHGFGHLGITVVPLGNGDGLKVVGIEPTSPAFPAGLLIDDEITTINGKRIAKFDDLVAGLRAAAQGDGNVSLLVRRRGTLDTINVNVGGKKAVTERPRLGVILDDSNGRLRVSGVEPNSPAARAGLRVGDEILTVNDYPVSTYDLFVGQIQAMGRAGGQVSIGVRRNGKMLTLSTVIGNPTPPALPKSELPATTPTGTP